MINKRLVNLIEGSMKTVWQNVAVQWAGLLCNIVSILAVSWVFGALLNGTLQLQSLLLCVAVVLAGVALRFVCSMRSAALSFVASDKVKLILRQKIYQKLLQLGPAYNEKVGTSEAVQVATEGVDQLEIYFSKYLPQLFYSLLAPLTLFVVLAFINLPSAVVLLVCVPLIPLSIMAVQKFAKKLLAKYWGKYTDLGDGFLENLQGLTTLKIYGSDEAKNEEMNQHAEEFRKITMRVLIMQLNSITVMDLIAYGGAAVGIIVSVTQYLAGNVSFAGCFAIILLAADFFIPLRMLGSFFHIAMNGMAASEKIFNLLDMPICEKGNCKEIDIAEGLQLTNVHYSYDNVREVLTDISFAAKKGITAIVGESGSGKSTIAAILTGRNQGYTGEVLVGGTPLQKLDETVLSEMITLVPHDAYLFKGTVRTNLLMANIHATDEQLWSALQKVKLDAFLQEENGLETLVEERASNFSGGQRQRLALARALLHNSPVYVFDEATSNIDVESENDIIEAIWEMGKTKTVVLISHRLASVVQAEHIYVLAQGKLVEQGKHEALLAQNGMYANMFYAQQQLEKAGKKEAGYA